jgi:hypothetical protein
MAPNAAQHHLPGRLGRVIHWLFPNRPQLIVEMAIEVAVLKSLS